MSESATCSEPDSPAFSPPATPPELLALSKLTLAATSHFGEVFSPPVVLISSDNDKLETTYRVVMHSGTINTSLIESGYDGDVEEPWLIPVPAINTQTLKLVIEWCTHHQHDKPVPDDAAKRELSAWDIGFLTIENQELFNLILAANFLDIQGLMDVTCRTVANMIKGKTSAEIRETFGITDDDEDSSDEKMSSEEKNALSAMKLATANLREGKQSRKRELEETPSRSESPASSYEDYDYS